MPRHAVVLCKLLGIFVSHIIGCRRAIRKGPDFPIVPKVTRRDAGYLSVLDLFPKQPYDDLIIDFGLCLENFERSKCVSSIM